MALLPVMTLVWTGSIIMAVGFVFGTGTAWVYHLRLYRTLQERGELNKNWIWRPHHHHANLSEPEKSYVLPWWYMGGAGLVGDPRGGRGWDRRGEGLFENASSGF